MVSEGTVRTHFLEPALDAQAENEHQALAIFNPTPEPDSLVEILKLLRAGSSRRPEQLLTLTQITRRIAISNQRERHHERTVAGAADRLARDLRDLQLNGGGEAILAAKSIARALQEPLRTLAGATRIDRDTIEALRAVDRVARQAPSLQVLSATVRYQLGERKYALLVELVGDTHHVNGAAAAGGRAGAEPIGTSDGHHQA